MFNIIDVIFKFGSPKRKTHKVFKNNVLFKIFKKYAFGIKKLKKKKFYNLYGLMKIWSKFNHSKVPNYQMVNFFK